MTTTNNFAKANKGYFQRRRQEKFRKECTECIQAAAVLGIAAGAAAGGYAIVVVGVEAALGAPAKIKAKLAERKAAKTAKANA